MLNKTGLTKITSKKLQLTQLSVNKKQVLGIEKLQLYIQCQ